MNKKNTQIILVPTDFTEAGDIASSYAMEMAKKLNYKLNLLHIINKETKTKQKNEIETERAVLDKLKEQKEILQQAAPSIEIECLAKEGSIFSAIGAEAESIGAEFLTMCTHGKVGMQKFTGSYAWKVVTSSPAPVIVMQKGVQFNGYKNIVLNIDSTMETKQKIVWAAHIAKMFNSTIHLATKSENDEFLNNKIKNNMAQIKKVLQKNEVGYVETKLDYLSGSLASRMEEYAKSISAELIVVISDKDKSTFILSPWAEQILFNKSKIPIMCINPVVSHITEFTPY